MNCTLRELNAQLRGADPASDDALALVLAGRDLRAGADARSCSLFGRLEAAVIDTWAASIARSAAGHHRDRHSIDELNAEARLWVVEQLAVFRTDPAGGSAGAFLRSRQSWFRSSVRRDDTPALKNKGSYRVVAVAGRQRERLLHELRREPTRDELRAATEEQIAADTRDKLIAKNPARKAADIEAEVRRRLEKDGVTKALREFGQVQVATASPVQISSFEDPDDALGALGATSVDTHVDAEELFEQLMRVALGENQWARSALSLKGGERAAGVEVEPDKATYRALSEEAGRTQAEIKSVLRNARCRISAPHAHWAHCAAGVVVDRAG